MSLAAVPAYAARAPRRPAGALAARRRRRPWSCPRWRTPARSRPRASSTRSRSCVALRPRPLPRAPVRRAPRRAPRRRSRSRSRPARRRSRSSRRSLTAPLVLALLRGRAGELRRVRAAVRAPRRSRRSLSSSLQAVRGRSLADLLGAYSIVGEGGLRRRASVAPLLALARRGADALRRDRPGRGARSCSLARGRGAAGPRVQEHLADDARARSSGRRSWSARSRRASPPTASRTATSSSSRRCSSSRSSPGCELGAPRPRLVAAVACRGVALALAARSSRTSASSASPRSRTRSG